MSGNPNTPLAIKVPFHILVADATLKPDTTLYLPIFVVDDSGTPDPAFPSNINDHEDDADYLDAYVFAGFGVEAFIVQVDGKTTVLDDDDIVGTKTAPLLDGPPAGTHYIVSAAFLTPLTPGNHVVSIGGVIKGKPVVFLRYAVTTTASRNSDGNDDGE